MELHQVRYFLTVAETLNFTRAAERCNVTQPALTKAIQKLEQELGGGLIYRERQLTQLTDLGKTVLPMLERTLGAAEAVRRQAEEYQRQEIAPLKIGLPPSISSTIIMEPLSEIARQIPALKVEILEGTGSRIMERLMRGEIHVVIAGNVADVPERVDRWPLFEERYVIVARTDHPLSRDAMIPLRSLRDVIFLERIECEMKTRLEHMCVAEGWVPRVGHRSAHDDHLQQMAASGFGVILAPEHFPRLPSLAAIPLQGNPFKRRLDVFAVAGRQHSPALSAFLKIVRVLDWKAKIEKVGAISA
jgi:DNA-binding transcriptional LysR family regulator